MQVCCRTLHDPDRVDINREYFCSNKVTAALQAAGLEAGRSVYRRGLHLNWATAGSRVFCELLSSLHIALINDSLTMSKICKNRKIPCDTLEEEAGDYTRIVMLISLTDTEL